MMIKYSKLISIKFQISLLMKECHGLFDYETEEILEKIFIKNNFGILYYNNMGFQFNKFPLDNSFSNSKYLLNYNIIKNDLKIYKLQENWNNENNFFWKVINDNQIKKNENIISKGQLIKLGKSLLIVKESFPRINNFSNYLEEYEFIEYKKEKIIDIEDYFQEKEYNSKSEISFDNNVFCKICYLNYNNDDNPLINICNCLGNMKYSHFDCVKEWLFHKMNEFSTENYQFYNYQNFYCELCKVKLPSIINYKDKKLNLIKYKKYDGNYLILELYMKENGNINYCPKGIYFINFNLNSQLTLGRGNDVDITLMDISVSRIHAKLSFKNNIFKIENLGSKFGTLIGPYKEMLIKENTTEEIQFGNINIKLTPINKNKKNIFPCCKNENKILEKETEIDLNSKTYGEFIIENY